MQANNFRHQDYQRKAEPEQFEILPAQQTRRDCATNCQPQTAELLSRNGVVAIYLLHGTFVGNDVLGLFRKVRSVLPSFAARLSSLEKKALDALARDSGNYTSSYAEQLARFVNKPDRNEILVRLFPWSGENSHVGRCDGSVRLLDDLFAQDFPRGGRVLLWGHSHGGNVLALLTNLLGADIAARDRFFRAAALHYAPFLRGGADLAWCRVRDALSSAGNPLRHVSLDIATFGTPIRYGWDENVAKHLVHFVNHRPASELPDDQAALPTSVRDVLQAKYGDLVQQFGVAGTGLSPGIWSWRSRISDRRLRRVVQAGVRRRDLFDRLRHGKRVADCGKTLLIDYHDADPPRRPPLFGHAVYTRAEWQAFHLQQVVKQFYQQPSPASGEGSDTTLRPDLR